jgi:hypothetical protein
MHRKGVVMKTLMIVLICGLMLAPLAAWGQKWIEPYTDQNGNVVQGHWQTPEDLRNERYSTPGKVNPYTGQFNSYQPGVMNRPQPYNPTPMPPVPRDPNPFYPQKDYRYQGY